MRSIVLLFILSVARCFAANYYSDYVGGSDTNAGTKISPWRLAPGMNGFAGSFTHAAGDHYILKGGVTWPHAAMPLSIPYSGTAGNLETYTYDATWYSGGSFTKPILDDGGNATSGGMIQAYIKNYWKIDGIQIDNYGVTLSSVGDKCIVLNSCHDVTITNCRSSPECKIWIYSYQDGGPWTNYPNLYFDFNDVDHVASFLWLTLAGSGVIYDNVSIRGNAIHDGHSQMVNGVHADMIIHPFPRTAGAYVDTLTISRNHVYGDWSKADASDAGLSGYIFQDAYIKNNIICNNVLTVYPFTSGQILEACSFGSDVTGGTTYFVGNTIDDTSNTGGPVINTGCSTGTTSVIENNIAIGGNVVSLADNTGTITWDYNCWSTTNGASVVGVTKTYAQWRALGYDAHPASPDLLGADPLFVTPHQDQNLQSGSPCRGVGANLTSIGIAEINLDFYGNARPSSGVWTIGAIEYGSSPTTSASALTGKAGLIGKASIK